MSATNTFRSCLLGATLGEPWGSFEAKFDETGRMEGLGGGRVVSKNNITAVDTVYIMRKCYNGTNVIF